MKVTNSAFTKTKLPRPRGKVAGSPPAPEPVHAKPRARVGEQIESSGSVRVTNPKGTRTHVSKGGASS